MRFPLITKWSISAFLLLLASAVTAALMTKHQPLKTTPNYTLTASDTLPSCSGVVQLTCSSTDAVIVEACTASLTWTTTSSIGENTSTITALGGAQTAPTIGGNTLNGANTSASPC